MFGKLRKFEWIPQKSWVEIANRELARTFYWEYVRVCFVVNTLETRLCDTDHKKISFKETTILKLIKEVVMKYYYLFML